MNIVLFFPPFFIGQNSLGDGEIHIFQLIMRGLISSRYFSNSKRIPFFEDYFAYVHFFWVLLRLVFALMTHNEKKTCPPRCVLNIGPLNMFDMSI